MSITMNCAGCFYLCAEWKDVFKKEDWTLVRVGKPLLSKLAEYITYVTSRHRKFDFFFRTIDEDVVELVNDELKDKVILTFVLSCLV